MKLEGWNVEKGFLRGSIDFVFEHDGKIYLIDWKSNLLTGYNPESLEKEVMEHYLLQLQIYTLAISYWFKLDGREKYENRFGGVFYIFLRGMPTTKVHILRARDGMTCLIMKNVLVWKIIE